MLYTFNQLLQLSPRVSGTTEEGLGEEPDF
jgi:hypothetical protein